jgi:hypothetical protein
LGFFVGQIAGITKYCKITWVHIQAKVYLAKTGTAFISIVGFCPFKNNLLPSVDATIVSIENTTLAPNIVHEIPCNISPIILFSPPFCEYYIFSG